MRRVTATRYVTALREGGSLPGLVEADDDGLYVAKFHGAGQGPGSLVAEVVAGELARAIGLRIPELVIVEIPAELGRAEPDPEIRDLIEASPGDNLGMDFLPGALPFDLAEAGGVTPELAASILWFDWLVTNIDRTPRNPNLLTWHGDIWLIDHGAAFFRQHGELPLSETAGKATPMLSEHVLLPAAGPVADAAMMLTGTAKEAAAGVVESIPSQWLGADPEAERRQFEDFLSARLDNQSLLTTDLKPDE